MATCKQTSGTSEQRTRMALRKAYTLMRRRFGHQCWWPADTAFEVCVGAILTQNTSWTNVERAIGQLKEANLLEPKLLYALPEKQLAQLIRPTGYFNIKARRLRAFLRVLVKEFDGDLQRMLDGPTKEVRHRLLSIKGIGEETADSMLLYAGDHLSFVIDAYTRRIFQRHGWRGTPSGTNRLPPDPGYEELQHLCERHLSHKPRLDRLDYWQDYHAQLVVIGKDYCRPRHPLCDRCQLEPLLPKKASCT